jgi:autotransporter-associated beta strand protein
MRKSLLAALFSFLLSAFLIEVARAQLTSLSEGFDDVTTLPGAGWVITNNSSPLGNHNWAQGIPPPGLDTLGANAQSGAPNSFIQTDFNAGLPGSGAIVSDWLITPVLSLENGATMSFYTQASPANTTFPNELQVWESLSGSGTVNVGSTAASPGGDFTIKLLDINPGATNPSGAPGGYPTTWTQFTFTISGLSATTDGRFGFRFYLPNNNTDGTIVGIDTFSFADPTVFTRTVSGNWTDTTGWTPNGVPNGNTVTAQLVNPGSGTNSVNLGGGTFTVNQLQFSGTNSGTWNVTNGTIIFDGTNPTFLNQGDSSGLVGSLPSLQLNANTTFEIDSASAVTEVTGAISGTGQLTKTGSGALVLIGTNTYSGGTTISAGTLQIGNGGTSGSIVGNVTDNGTLAFDRSDTVAFGSVISGTGSLVQLGSGTLVLTGTNTYSGGTTISAGTLQIGNGGTTGSITGNVTDNGTLAFNRSDAMTFDGVISGTGSLVQLGMTR